MHEAGQSKGVLSLVAVGSADAVPSGVPYPAVAHLASLDTPEIREWVEANAQYAVYVVAGMDVESEGVPAFSVAVTPGDYLEVIAAMPR